MRRVLCHFPDKLAHGAFVEGKVQKRNAGILNRICIPILPGPVGESKEYFEPLFVFSSGAREVHVGQADVILPNSRFTARVMTICFTSLKTVPKAIYPGINIQAYETSVGTTDADIVPVASPSRPTLLSQPFRIGEKCGIVEAFFLP